MNFKYCVLIKIIESKIYKHTTRIHTTFLLTYIQVNPVKVQ